jgi:acyl carrier protein phosphodiesterase
MEMNYLAHAYLSFHHRDILVGNMVSDFIKGARQFDYPPLVQKGIRLHRDIDRFTDIHQATAEGKLVVKKDYGLYSGAIVDVIYDHFLANDPGIFPNDSLAAFADEVYNVLEEEAANLPAGFLVMLPYMKMHNWLYSYRTIDGIGRALQGLVRRAAYLSDHETAFRLLKDNYSSLEHSYRRFMPDVKDFAKERMAQLIS